MHYFYITRSQDSTLYVGITNNPQSRINRHNEGQGSEWIKQHGQSVIVYTEEYPTYIEARKREIQVKKWSRQKKENLISGKWGKR